nr:hypothetical protein CFP56_23962 [Quercus suber]
MYANPSRMLPRDMLTRSPTVPTSRTSDVAAVPTHLQNHWHRRLCVVSRNDPTLPTASSRSLTSCAESAKQCRRARPGPSSRSNSSTRTMRSRRATCAPGSSS